MNALRIALVLTTLCLLSGCMGGNFLVGKWTFDKEKTLEEITAATSADPGAEEGQAGGLLRGIVGGLQKGLSMVVVTQMEGTDIEFTKTEMRKIRGGSGSSLGYEIIERVDADTYLVQYADGDIVTWGRTDSGIRMNLGAEEEVWVYFRPIEGK